MPSATRANFAILLGLAWIIASGWLLWQFWAPTADMLTDPDDAMRLVQVRAFLAGRGWFDLFEPRVDPPAGYVTHWSRLVDAGLAGLFVLFNLFADGALAERLTRALWPLIWLLPAMAGVAAIAWRLAGREAAVIALVLATFGLPAFQHFTPGRIDHHNVQIALAVLAVAATAWSDRARWSAPAAGLLTGLALAVGLENLPYLAVCGAALLLRYVRDRDGGPALADYGFGLAASTLAAFLVNVGPDQWTRTACDAIAINWAAPVVLAGLALAVAGRTCAGAWLRCAAAGAAACGALALFIAIEPRCLGGPFAMMEVAAKATWLAEVREMEALVPFAAGAPVMGAWITAFPAGAILAALALAGSKQQCRDFGFLVASAALVVAVAATIAMAKAYSYAIWLGMPLMAALATRLFAVLGLRTAVARLAVVLALTPTALAAGAIAVAQAALDFPQTAKRADEACFRAQSYAPLARLPAGLLATHVDYGPFVLALTPHSVIAAPYHRLSAAIIAAHEIFTRPESEARVLLGERGASYVAICRHRAPARHAAGGDRGASERVSGLWDQLQAGEVFGWLEPIENEPGAVFAIYRVRAGGGS